MHGFCIQEIYNVTNTLIQITPRRLGAAASVESGIENRRKFHISELENSDIMVYYIALCIFSYSYSVSPELLSASIVQRASYQV